MIYRFLIILCLFLFVSSVHSATTDKFLSFDYLGIDFYKAEVIEDRMYIADIFYAANNTKKPVCINVHFTNTYNARFKESYKLVKPFTIVKLSSLEKMNKMIFDWHGNLVIDIKDSCK